MTAAAYLRVSTEDQAAETAYGLTHRKKLSRSIAKRITLNWSRPSRTPCRAACMIVPAFWLFWKKQRAQISQK